MQIRILRARPSLLRLVTTAFLVVILASCVDSLRTFGPSPAVAESHADELFEAFATRFGPNNLAPSYDAARVRLAQAALVPSRVFNDTTIWESRPSPTHRAMFVSGEPEGGKYHLEIRPALTPAARPGDTRHTITLEQLDPNAYRWDTRVDLALGAVTADEMSAFFTSLFAGAEDKTDAELRSDYRAAFPRAAAAFGHGFSVDSLHVAAGVLGTTSVTLTGGFHPDQMKATYPALSGYLDKYLGPAKYHFVLTDHAGTSLFDITGADRAMTLRWRVQHGKLTSLFGPPKPWPDSLTLTADLTLKVKVFTVGVQGLVGDFVMSNTGHERAWTVVAQKDPKWVLPFITERLIRSPLHRPFAGPGAMLRFAVRDSAGAQSLLSRRTRLDVQESAIMRFIGSLSSHAMGDLNSGVEAEEDRFLHDGFAALQADLRVLGPRWREKAPPEAPGKIENATKP